MQNKTLKERILSGYVIISTNGYPKEQVKEILNSFAHQNKLQSFVTSGEAPYYRVGERRYIAGSSYSNELIINIKELQILSSINIGERVLNSLNDYEEGIFIGLNPSNNKYVVCTDNGYVEFDNIKPKPVTITLKQISEKFNLPIGSFVVQTS